MSELGTAANPVSVAINRESPGFGQMLAGIVITMLPVAIAVLMQKPALRQVIAMRVLHGVKVSGYKVADLGNLIAGRAATQYNKVKL